VERYYVLTVILGVISAFFIVSLIVQLILQWSYSPHCKYVQHEGEEEVSMLSAGWIIGSILLPIVGLIVGIWGLCKGREGAGGLFAISVVVWIVWLIIIL